VTEPSAGGFDNAHHLLQGALKATPPATHPPRPFHGGGPMPKFDAAAYVVATLWLADRVSALVDPRDRAAFDLHVAAARAEVLAPKGDAKRLTVLRVADAKSSSRVPCKVGLWAANEAFNASTHSIYAGTPTRAAGANVAKLLLKTAPAEVPAYLAALDALCVHLEFLTVLRAREKELPVSAVATPFRGLTDGKPTHYVVELVDGRYALLGKQGARWQLHVGKRQEVLATVPDTLFAAAVAAVGEG